METTLETDETLNENIEEIEPPEDVGLATNHNHKEYPHWEKGEINWRLYVSQGMFGAAKTKETAYEQTQKLIETLDIDLPPLETIIVEC